MTRFVLIVLFLTIVQVSQSMYMQRYTNDETLQGDIPETEKNLLKYARKLLNIIKMKIKSRFNGNVPVEKSQESLSDVHDLDETASPMLRWNRILNYGKRLHKME